MCVCVCVCGSPLSVNEEFLWRNGHVDMVESEIESPLPYYVYFWTNTFGKKYVVKQFNQSQSVGFPLRYI